MTEQPAHPVIRAAAVGKSFGSATVLDGVDFTCGRGEVHALLGANGAGKSTLIQILTGVYRPDEGEIEVGGRPVRFKHPRDAVAAGVAAVYQEMSLVDDLTVAENVFLGQEPRKRGKSVVVDRSAMAERCRRLLEENRLDVDPGADMRALSLARRQRVEIAKALARNAEVVIFDEPTASLTADEQESLFTTILDLKARGVSSIYVSHRLEEIFRIADRVTVLRDGKVVLNAAVRDLTRDAIIEAMVGTRLVEKRWNSGAGAGKGLPPILSVKSLCGPRFDDITFDVGPGEIVALAGLVGSGRSSLLGTLFGHYAATSGEVWLHGERLDLGSVRKAVGAGVALVTEDRRRTGLALSLRVEQNMTAVTLPTRLGFYRRRTARALARREGARARYRGDVRMQAGRLSGGNQQKIALSKWFGRRPKVLLCDEPTRGIDVGARSDIYELLRGLAEDGVAVVVASSDLEEVLSLCDRILVMNKGRLVAEVRSDQVTEHELMQHATGALEQGTEPHGGVRR